MLGIVGDRPWVRLPPDVLSSSALLLRRGWKLLADRSCRGVEGGMGLRFEMEREEARVGNGCWGMVPVKGVLP